MKKINNLLTSTLFVLFAVLLGSSVAFAQAEPKIVVNDDNVVFLNTDGETTVSINLNNVDTDCNAVQFNFNFTGLKVKSYAFTDRVDEKKFTTTVKTSASQGIVAIIADSEKSPIAKGTGAIMTVTFEPAAGYPSLNITDIKIAGTKKGDAYDQFTQANIHVDVNATITLASAESFNIAAGEEKTLDLAITNPLDIYGFQFEVALPEGLTLTDVEGTERLVNSKINEPSVVSSNVYRILVYSKNSTTAIAPGEGPVLVLTIVAAANLGAENLGDIKIYNFNASVGDPDDGSDNIAENELVIPVTNLVFDVEEAAAEDMADINEIAAAIQEFNEMIDDEWPGYAVAHADELAGLTKTLEDLWAALEAAMSEAEKAGEYNGIQAEIVAANEAVMAASANFDAALAAIENEYNDDIESINELANAIQDFNNEVDEYFPAFAEKHAEELAALTQDLTNLYESLNSALAEADKTGVYEGYSQELYTKTVEDLLALEAQRAEALAAIENKYNDDIESINELANALQEFNDQVAEKFPGYAELAKDQIAALTKTIEDLNNKVIAAMEAVNETGTYDGLTDGEITAANEALSALVAGEQEALNALNEAFEATTQEIAELSDKLLDIIENENAPQGVKIEAETLLNAVDDMFYAADEAYDKAFEGTGVYESPVNAEDIAEIAAKIAELEELSAINGIATDAQGARYFDINGREVVNPAAGKVYIKVENGKATKHINK